MFRPPYLFITIIAAFVFVASFLFFYRYAPYKAKDLGDTNPPELVFVLEDAKLFARLENTPMWELQAERVEIDSTRENTTLRNIHDGKIYDDGQSAFDVMAGKAQYSEMRKVLDVTDGITVHTTRDETITAESASWDMEKRVLTSKSPVVVEYLSNKLQCEKMTMDFKDDTLQLWDVQMSFNVDEVENRLQKENSPR